jgi:cytohesin
LAEGADVNAKDDYWYGETPLHYAAGKGHKELVELLIAKGASLRAKALWKGLTPLHEAASNGHREITELLIAKGADVNAKDEGGQTPLHLAAFWGHKEIAAQLIAKGADVNAKTYNGETPLDKATNPDNPNDTEATTDLLRKHGGKTGQELKAEGK